MGIAREVPGIDQQLVVDAAEEDWGREYLSMDLTVRVVGEALAVGRVPSAALRGCAQKHRRGRDSFADRRPFNAHHTCRGVSCLTDPWSIGRSHLWMPVQGCCIEVVGWHIGACSVSPRLVGADGVCKVPETFSLEAVQQVCD